MGSSEHKSSTRRFKKVLSTLKGNSPNSSLNVLNKEESESSDTYYERNGSPLVVTKDGDVQFMKVKGKNKHKKNSSRNVRDNELAENCESALKSDRSARNTNSMDLIQLSVGELQHRGDAKEEFIKKLDSDEIKLPLNDDDQNLAQADTLVPKNNFMIEKLSSQSGDLKSSEHENYLDDLDSPLSTDSNS